MNIKKWFLAVGLLAAGLILMVCGRAFALPAYNTGVVDYQNLALTNYETWSNFILITPITGPWLSALKEQKRWRGSGSYSIANVAVVYGDSVQYRFTIINETKRAQSQLQIRLLTFTLLTREHSQNAISRAIQR